MTVELPDVEGAARAYLRAHTDVQAVVAQRVWFGIPNAPVFPLVTVARVGGFDDASDVPVDQALLQFDCWGSIHDDTRNSPDKAEADRVRLAVRQALYDLRTPVDVDLDLAVVRLALSSIQSDPYLPDPKNHRPRYAVTAQLTALKLIPTP